MNGKLAKAIRKAANFYPADERQYKLADTVWWWTGHIVGTAVAVEGRNRYQGPKHGVLAAKRAAA